MFDFGVVAGSGALTITGDGDGDGAGAAVAGRAISVLRDIGAALDLSFQQDAGTDASGF